MNSIKALSLALGVSISYLLGLTDDPHEDSFNAAAFDLALNEHLQIKKKERATGLHVDFSDRILRNRIKTAEAALMRTVHEICGMNEFSTPGDLQTDTLNIKSDIRKLDIIREYLEDSSVILKKMFAQLPEEPERDKEDPEAPAPETK